MECSARRRREVSFTLGKRVKTPLRLREREIRNRAFSRNEKRNRVRQVKVEAPVGVERRNVGKELGGFETDILKKQKRIK